MCQAGPNSVQQPRSFHFQNQLCWRFGSRVRSPPPQKKKMSRPGLPSTQLLNSTGSSGFCDRASWANCEVREKTNKMQQLDVYYQHFLNMFRASLCPSSGEQDVCYCNIRRVLLKMGIIMPETCWEIVKNKHLTVASCWFSLSLHNQLGPSTPAAILHPFLLHL